MLFRLIKVFYDKFEEAALWGKDLFQHLDDIYKNKAQYSVVFVSKFYATKLWTNHELKSLQDRALNEIGREYILPAIFDDTEVPGIRSTTGFVDLRKKSPEQLAQLILKKLETKLTETKEIQSNFNIPMPRVKKKFTDLEKKEFLNESFLYLKEYFKAALTQLAGKHNFIKHEIEEINKNKILCSVYYYGEVNNICKIWVGGLFNKKDCISYYENTNEINPDNDSVSNDGLNIEDDGDILFFNSWGSAFEFTRFGLNPHKLTKETLAQYLWSKFTRNLEQ